VKRLLILAPTPTSSAATRFRLEQFFPALRAAGIEPTLRPFLDETGFRILYQPGRHAAKLLAALWALRGRLADLIRARSADAVLIFREAALVGPPVIEWLLSGDDSRPLVFDLDDAIWVPYASPTYGAMLSKLLKAPEKADFTLKSAHQVIAGNDYLASRARKFGTPVEVIPTVVDTEIFRPAPEPHELPVLGWIGTHSTVQYLRAIVPALRRLAERRRFILRIVGGHLDEPALPIEERPWRLDREVADFQSLDVGLYPLVEDPWSVGKSGFKAVQYMACGVPVVASPVGVTRTMIRHGENGLLAADDDGWVDSLTALLDDAALRRRLGEAGRVDAVGVWSLATHASRFVDVIRRVMV
jgi:glycosyltransferase involved in cell wall biosynthesis